METTSPTMGLRPLMESTSPPETLVEISKPYLIRPMNLGDRSMSPLMRTRTSENLSKLLFIVKLTYTL